MSNPKLEGLRFSPVDNKWLTLALKPSPYSYSDADAAEQDGWDFQGFSPEGHLIFEREMVASVTVPAPAPAPTPTPIPIPTPAPVPNSSVTAVSIKSNSVDCYSPFEVAFDLPNLSATNLQFPYDPNPPVGVPAGVGVTVDLLVSRDGDNFANMVVHPAFSFQDYTRSQQQGQEHMAPGGARKWRARFTPTAVGTYTYKIRVVDAQGERFFYPASPNDTFSCIASNSKGFVKVAKRDARCFEYSDGSPFLATGLNAGWSASSGFLDNVAATLQSMADNGLSIARVWLTNLGLIGSAWSQWNSHHYAYDGYLPGNGLSSEDAYPGHQFSIKLDTAHRDVFQGWFDNVPVLPNKTYKLMARIKTNGLTGSGNYGFVLKKGGWMGNTDCHTEGKGTNLLGPIASTANNDWQEVSAAYKSGASEYFLGNLYATTHNITGGKVYIDEISLREDLGSGQYGPEMFKKPKANSHHYYDEIAAKRIDLLVEAAEKAGVTLKPVLLEKNDGIFGRLKADSSLIADAPDGSTNQGDNENFYSANGLAVRRLHEYYWRYCMARWGYSTAIHSWELINEGNPGSARHYDATNALATLAQQVDAHQHPASTSNWHSAPVSQFWGNKSYPAVGFGDSHIYVQQGRTGSTDWLEIEGRGLKGPLTGIDVTLDSAVFIYEHSMDIAKKFGGVNVKPYLLGELGFKTSAGLELGNNDNSDDTWLHQLIWAGINPGGLSGFLYWFDNNFKAKHRYSLYKPYAAFMQGIGVNNGLFSDIKLSGPANCFGWGQKDTQNGAAYFWLYDKGFTYVNPSGGANVNGSKVSFDGLPARTYTIEWWDTWAGSVASTSQLNHTGGVMSLQVPTTINHKDVACKVY